MSAALAITPASGSLRAKIDTARIDVTGAEDNRAPNNTGGAFKYYILADAPSGDDLRSHEFNVSSDGKHSWMDVTFPVAGSWTLRLKDSVGDGDVATASVTVV